MSALREPARPSALGAFAPEPERAGSEPSVTEPSWEQGGSLGIKERRSWQTWQLAVAVFVAMVLGMGIGHTGGGGNSQASSDGTTGGGTARFVPPPPSGSGSSTATTVSSSGSSASSGTSSSPTTSASSPTPTTPASGTPTTQATPAASGGADAVLLPRTTGTGAQTLPGFTAGGPWRLGWAYQCASAPSFQVMVVPEGGSPSSQPAVDKAGASGQGVSEQTATGKLHLEIHAGPTCRWAVKASGAGG